MAGRMVFGELVGIIDGPSMVLSVKGEEQKFTLGVDVSMAWVAQHMDKPVTVMVEDGRVVDIG